MRSIITSFLLPLLAAAVKVPYEEYILAPASRNLVPTSVYQVNGSVTNTNSSGKATFNGLSSFTLDFGKNVAGLVSLDVESVSSPSAFLGVTFTESNLWISSKYSDATGNSGYDSVLWFDVGKGAGVYTPGSQFQRGAFRYLTVVSNTSATINLNSVHVNFTAAPMQSLRDYTGWFHSDDELINRIWYAGAYTNQLATIEPTAGDAITSQSDDITVPETNAWYNNYTITNGKSTITDGAKRDRLVWPGDMAISLESIAVSTGDLYSIRMGLESLLALQKADGQLPYAGLPFNGTISYTYHLHNLIGVSFLYRFSGDTAWLSSYWDQYVRGVEWALEAIDDSGLANVTWSADWLRYGMGGHNIEANGILHFVLKDAQNLARDVNQTSMISHWASVAAGIKTAANELLWDSEAGLYRDNETTTLHPQDGNTWAIKSGLTSSNQSTIISKVLQARWGKYGAPAPEAGATISPFIGGFELQAHYIAKQPNLALDLLRLQWGYMLLDSKMTQSTLIEGYSTDGSIHYAPYIDDARISHAHGWSTGPTYALTAYAAGIQLTGPGGSSWKIAPQPGDLTTVDAGLSTSRGVFSVQYTKSSSGQGYSQFSFSTPTSTKGSVRLPGVIGTLVSSIGQKVKLVNGVAVIPGGNWELETGSH
ncbi:uncharacterized protein N7483_001558 [Penicillium malachiteum]|uniref:uncharacterized protein n=1 Tax=Penicillium malachiteum TaxID=1324776 RepID=UPI0025488012|nr:uncharacterized protein N7483_001558 [Penicillium malachiteum]KAJ5736433.1 hypothetical protein N7483_001558 [Penicillium malachiteum]